MFLARRAGSLRPRPRPPAWEWRDYRPRASWSSMLLLQQLKAIRYPRWNQIASTPALHSVALMSVALISYRFYYNEYSAVSFPFPETDSSSVLPPAPPLAPPPPPQRWRRGEGREPKRSQLVQFQEEVEEEQQHTCRCFPLKHALLSGLISALPTTRAVRQ